MDMPKRPCGLVFILPVRNPGLLSKGASFTRTMSEPGKKNEDRCQFSSFSPTCHRKEGVLAFDAPRNEAERAENVIIEGIGERLANKCLVEASKSEKENETEANTGQTTARERFATTTSILGISWMNG